MELDHVLQKPEIAHGRASLLASRWEMQLSRSFALPEPAHHLTVSVKKWLENRLEELGEISSLCCVGKN